MGRERRRVSLPGRPLIVAFRNLLEDSTVLDVIVESVRAGLPLVTAARKAGVSASRVSDWLHAGKYGTTYGIKGHEVGWRNEQILKDFVYRVELARAGWEAEHLESISKQALGKGKNGRPEWKASAWLLNNHPDTRQTYRQEKNAIEDRRESLPIYQQVATLTDDELKALASGNDTPAD